MKPVINITGSTFSGGVAFGDKSTAYGANYYNSKNDAIMIQLSKELQDLHTELKSKSKKLPEHYAAIGAIEEAKNAALENDSSKLVPALKIAGKWALDVAREIGVSVAEKAISQAISS